MTATCPAGIPPAPITTSLPLRRLVLLCEQAAQALSGRSGRRRRTRVRLHRVGAYRLDYAVLAGRGTVGHVSVSFSEQGERTVLRMEGPFAAPMRDELAARVRDADASAGLSAAGRHSA
jgi:hypothetical protein